MKSPKNFVDRTGQRYGRLVAVECVRSSKAGNWQTSWLCKCDCGNTVTIKTTNLRHGITKSCGCYRRDILFISKSTHGMTSKQKVHEGLISPSMGVALEYIIWSSAKARARKSNLEFSIVPTDILIPEKCPYLGITLTQGSGRVCDASPSLDRIDPAIGYTKENIEVISFRANTIKAGRTRAELEKELLSMLAALGDFYVRTLQTVA